MNAQYKSIALSHTLRSLLTIMLLFISTHASAQPATSDTYQRFTKIEIIPQHADLKAGDEITLAVQIDLSNNWHAYWRNPGDSGLPVSIKWDLPEGFEVSDINWPTPNKISYYDLVNYGYYNRVTLLQTLKVPAVIPQGKISLKANLALLICNEICIPEDDEISIYLNDPNNLDIDNSQIINTALSKLPQTIKGQFSFRNDNELLSLSLTPEDRTILKHITQDNTEFFPYERGTINHAAPAQIVLDDGKLTIAHKLGDEPIDLKKILEGLLVIKGDTGQNTGYLIRASASDKPIIINTPDLPKDNNLTNNETKSLTLISAIILAFLGGLALNLMPCVFPVLSIKALSLAQMNGQKIREARLHGIAYTLGVIISFLLIAGALIALKHAGAAIGWGFQFQNPLIVAMLAYLLFLIGLSLAGLFEIGAGLTSIGGKLTGSHFYNGSFFTGVLASIVATPCTAPFMGAAMGFALTQTAFVSLTIFAVLGLGLAMPYLLLSFIPAARVFLPKPGAWMETFKQFLAFPMFASALWLIHVISILTGTTGIFLSLFGLLLIAFAVWLARITKSKTSEFGDIVAKTTMIAAIIGVIYTLGAMHSLRTPATSTITSDQETIPYTKAALSKALNGDDPVFVEMTAAWCITCKVNNAIAISTQATRDLFRHKNVQHIVGDWTSQDTEITEYLDAFEHNGVPLYVYYGKRDTTTKIRPQAIILPQIMTAAGLRRALESF